MAKLKDIKLILEGGTALSSSQELTDPELPRERNSEYFKKRYSLLKIQVIKPLLLSENSTFLRYFSILKKINASKQKKIILVTGTDNLPFLSSFLDLHNQDKLIVICYSQRSLSRPTTEIFRTIDLLIPKLNSTFFNSTLVATSIPKKLILNSSSVVKVDSYKKVCFKDLLSKKTSFGSRRLSDSGTLILDKVIKKRIKVILKTPFSKTPTAEEYVLLPGLGNPDTVNSHNCYSYCLEGPALSTYSVTGRSVKNNWIRNIVKDYCVKYCSKVVSS